MEIYVLNNLDIIDDDTRNPKSIENEKLKDDIMFSFGSDKTIYVISPNGNENELEYLYQTAFSLSDLPFKNVKVINNEQEANSIEPNGIIILEDCPTINMMDFIMKANLRNFLKKYEGTIIACGRSGKNLSSDVIDLTAKEVYHEGLGIIKMAVEPNIDKMDANSSKFKSLISISLLRKVYGLSQDSYIKIEGNSFEFVGDIKEIDDEIVYDVETKYKKI